MKQFLTRPIRWIFNKMGYDIVPKAILDPDAQEFPPDFEATEIETWRAVAPYTLTGPIRTVALLRAVQHLVRQRIPGDIVECGVWKGGSMMAVAHTLRRLNERRRLWLFDTFEGMSAPTAEDVSVCNFSAEADYKGTFLRVGLDEVRHNVLSTGYDESLFTFVKGKVEDTIPGQLPEQIALLRLDTDWFDSTWHELVHLYPRLVPGGVLIIDDYGHWKGARKATDEYLEKNNIPLLLHRIDFSARIATKP